MWGGGVALSSKEERANVFQMFLLLLEAFFEKFTVLTIPK
jgi:hypothetical protein